MATTTDDRYCEHCGTGPTCAICGRDDRRRGGNYDAAQLSFVTASVIQQCRDTNPLFQRCGGGVRVMRKRIGG